MEAPLDLSDEQRLLQGAELDAALANLDDKGWNVTGNLNRSTWQRVWFQHCRIREDILEVALGSGDEDISKTAEQIRFKLERMHESYPSFMRVSPEELLSRSDLYVAKGFGSISMGNKEPMTRQINAIFTLCIHAGIIHTEFLLQRALVNRMRKDTKELIPISKRMLGLVLLAQSNRDFFRDFQGELVYMVSNNLYPALNILLTESAQLANQGLPAAGVLAIELLKQEQSRLYTPDILPRSETIQDLSVFISSLAAVGPGEGNFNICNQGRRALKKVLDQILSPQVQPQPGAQGMADHQVFDDVSLYFPTGNDAEFLQWLENVEWDKGGMFQPSQEAPQ